MFAARPTDPAPSASSVSSVSGTPTTSGWSDLLRQPIKQSAITLVERLRRDPLTAQSFIRDLLTELPFSPSDRLLLTWLDVAIYGQPDPTPVKKAIEKFIATNQSGGPCGKQFKPGEVAYQCSYCGIDPTCIQCVGCYRESDHAGHEAQVRMTRAGGGGCCDCGDGDSWKVEGTCKKHAPRKDGEEEEVVDITPLLPSTTEQLAVIQALLLELIRVCGIAFDISDPLHSSCISAADASFVGREVSLTPGARPTHLVLLLNDDVHSFDDVTGQLQQAIGITAERATGIANQVHGVGRAIMAIGPLAACESAARKMAEIGLGLEVHPIDPSVTILQESRLLALVDYLSNLATSAHQFRDLLANASMQARESQTNSVKSADSSSASSLDSSAPSVPPSSAAQASPSDVEMSDAKSEVTVPNTGYSNADPDDAHESDDDTNGDSSRSSANGEPFIDEEDTGEEEEDEEGEGDEDEEDDEDEEPEMDEDEFEGDEGASDGQMTQGMLERMLRELTEEALANGEQPITPNDLLQRLFERQRARQAALVAARQRRATAGARPAAPVVELPQELRDDVPLSPAANDVLQSAATTPTILHSFIRYSTFLAPNVFERVTALVFGWFSNTRFKQQYALEFLRQLEVLLAQWTKFNGDLPHSALDYAVQLFTIPSIAMELSQNHALFEVLTHHLYTNLASHRKFESDGRSSIDCVSLARSPNPFILLISHIEYTLRCKDVPIFLLTKRPALTLRQWFRVLELAEGMDVIVRKVQSHVLYESSSWKHAFTLAIRANNITQLLLNAITHFLHSPTVAPSDRQNCITEVRSTIDATLQRRLKLAALEAQKLSPECVGSVVRGVPLLTASPDRLSLHHPLTKFISETVFLLRTMSPNSLATFPLSLIDWPITLSKSTSSCSSESAMDLASPTPTDRRFRFPAYHHAVDLSSRMLAFQGHARAGLFVRNGQSLQNQVYNYTRPDVSSLFARADVTALQLAVAEEYMQRPPGTSSSSVWIEVLTRRFGLEKICETWSPYESPRESLPKVAHLFEWSSNEKIFPILESLLETILVVLTDRERIGRRARMERIRDTILHRLMIAPCTYSQLVKGVDSSVADDDDDDESIQPMQIDHAASQDSSSQPSASAAAHNNVPSPSPVAPIDMKAIIRELATFHAGSAGDPAGSGVWTLKREHFVRFNPYHASYTVDQRQAAESNYLNRLKEAAEKSTKSTDIGIYPPTRSFSPYAQPVFDRLTSSTLESSAMDLIFSSLRRYVRIPNETDLAAFASYVAPPSAGGLRGTHERIVTHSVYLLALAADEALKQISAVGPSSSASYSASSGTSSTESARRFLSLVVQERTTPKKSAGSSTRVALSILDLLCQFVVSSQTQESSVAYSDWRFTLQLPLLKDTIRTIQRIDDEIRRTNATGSVVSPILAAYSLDAVVSTDSSVSSSIDSQSNRAIRRQRGLKIRRRIVKEMQRKLVAFAEHNHLDVPVFANSRSMKASQPIASATSSASVPAVTPSDSFECIVCRAPASTGTAGFIAFYHPTNIHSATVQVPPSEPFQPRQRVIQIEPPGSTSVNEVIRCTNRGLPLAIPSDRYVPDVRDTAVSTVVRSCHHVIHFSCLDSYVAGLWHRQHAGQPFEGHQSVDLQAHEFMCPMDRQVANCLIPIPEHITPAKTPQEEKNNSGDTKPPAEVFRCAKSVAPLPVEGLSSSSLLSWIDQSHRSMLMADSASRPPSRAASSAIESATLIGLIDQVGSSIAQSTGRAPSSIDAFGRVRFLVDAILNTIRGVELGERISSITFGEKKLKGAKSASADGGWTTIDHTIARHTHERQFIGALVDDGILLVSSPQNDVAWRHLRSTLAALITLVHTGVDSSTITPNATKMSDSPISPSPSASSPTKSSATSGFRSLMSNVASRVLRGSPSSPSVPTVATHPDDIACMPMLTARELFLEDPFELLLRVTLAHGFHLSPSENTKEIHHALALLWNLHVVQICAHIANATGEDNQHAYVREYRTEINQHAAAGHAASSSSASAPSSTVDSSALKLLVSSLRGAGTTASLPESCCSTSQIDDFASLALPFLRQSTILMQSIGIVSTTTTRSNIAASRSPIVDEFSHLLDILMLPSVQDVITGGAGSDNHLSPLIHSMVNEFHTANPPNRPPTMPLLTAFAPPEFVRLPLQYDALFQALSDDATNRCHQCGNTPRDPALCLTCGRLLCAQQACCKEGGKGELTRHTERCASENGYYLLIREAGVIALSRGLSHPIGSCYADAENELDMHMRRGRLLFRQPQRLEQIRHRMARQETMGAISRARNVRYLQEISARNVF